MQSQEFCSIKQLDTSYTELRFFADPKSQQRKEMLKQTLSIERPDWRFDYLVKIGRKSKYDFHFIESGNSLVISSGILEIPPVREILNLEQLQEQPQENFEDFLESLDLPFKPYDYQVQAFQKALTKQKKLSLMCTGSGKSLTISLCLEWFRRQNLKGVLVVPNINLLTQFANDIKSYNLLDLHQNIITFGGGSGSKKLKQMKDANTMLQPQDLVITTWQSLVKLGPEFFKSLDFIICDEVHKFSSDCTSRLVLDSKNAKYKLGFTGTLPDSKTNRLTLIGLFGIPETIITPNDLVESGRGTPIKVTAVKIKHSTESSFEMSKKFEFLDKLKHCISIEERSDFIAKLAKKFRGTSKGSSLVLYSLTEHGVDLYLKTLKEIHGETRTEIPSFEEMKKFGVFFMNGSSTAKEREEIRQVMDKDLNAVLVANYALLSTGVNIKSLRFAVLASPVKSSVTVAQSLGRGIRLSDGKEIFDVYDIVDDFKGTGIFKTQFNARKKVYEKSGFEVSEGNVIFS